MISVIDSHTEGEPTRLITGGIPALPGKSIVEKRDYFKKHLDPLRKLLMREPRGHQNMFGAVLVDPTDDRADVAAIFMDSYGYLNMCGHGSIAIAKIAVELGLFIPKGEHNRLTIETPAGLVHAWVHPDASGDHKVTIRNVPSFLYQQDVRVHTPNLGEVRLDIAYGGNFFALVDASLIGDLHLEQLDRFIGSGMEILDAVSTIPIRHPMETHIDTIDLVDFSGPPQGLVAQATNMAVFGKRQVDRSPCGTGTSAKMAALYAQGKLALHEPFCTESILGTVFVGELEEEVQVGHFTAVVPLITGSAHITAISHIVLESMDPLKQGFQLLTG